jgi:putative FmdB family regulatory protein
MFQALHRNPDQIHDFDPCGESAAGHLRVLNLGGRPHKNHVETFSGGASMPTYDYVCLACDRKFSLRMSIIDHEKRKAKCPKCGSKKLRQRIEVFSAVTAKKS